MNIDNHLFKLHYQVQYILKQAQTCELEFEEFCNKNLPALEFPLQSRCNN